jgi:serine/threonine protein kinase/tetratricopeptide (TPR) repeat protein
MDRFGLTDSPSDIGDSPCRCCASAARIAYGLCACCLLRDSLQSEASSIETFKLVLAEIDVPAGDWQFGNYQILEEIGRGGMGVIYRARQRHSRRVVAVKRLLSYHSDSKETLMRFQREAEAAASLDHPNILPIYEVGLDEAGLPFFSMKFAPGGSLFQIAPTLRDQSRRAVQLLVRVTRAIDYAHTSGVLHRDLKPGNILLDCRGEPMIADFGLARWIGSTTNLTRTITVFGTPGYIAPEQIQSPKVSITPAADVYSLGAILFEVLAGRPPFLGEHALAVINQAAEKPAPLLRSINSKLSRDLETICARCLERDPSSRYRSAGELADDLERWLDGRAILARRVSFPAQVWGWSRRNPALATSLAGCLILGTATIAWQWQNHHLEATINSEAVALHSVTVLPFFNLDTIEADPALAKTAADTLSKDMSSSGPSRAIGFTRTLPKWTGTGNYDEILAAAQQTNSRSVLTGTIRRTAKGFRISLRLFARNGNDVLGSWTLELNGLADISNALGSGRIGSVIYNALEQQDEVSGDAQVDPVIKNEESRGYFITGRALIDRRTIPDMDRAIKCFEAAIKAEPRSISARSYLALAYMGRNFLSSDPGYLERAFRVAQEALQLSADDASPHRALCALYIATGQLDEALEHGFRAIELGDASERAFGQVGFIWKEMGRPDKAIQWFYKAKVSTRQPADYEGYLGDCWMLLGQNDKAREAYKTCQNFHPDLPDGWLGLCHLELIDEKFDDARTLFNRHSAEYAEFHTSKPLLAQIDFFARNFNEAERLYNEIRQSDPLGVGAQQYGAISSESALARLRIAAGDLRSARTLLEECRKTDNAQLAKAPRSPEVLYRLAADEAIGGNTPIALAYLQASINAGWIDYRSPQLDPRFDNVSNTSEFRKILSELSAHVTELSRQAPSGLQISAESRIKP